MMQFLQRNYRATPEKVAFVFYDPYKKSETKLSYSQLAAFTEQLGLQLLDHNLYGKTALLVYDDVFKFIISFLACHYAGIIPIPVLFTNSKRQFEKILHIHFDSQADLILSSISLKDIFERQDRTLMDKLKGEFFYTPDNWEATVPSFNNIHTVSTAFVQYTSGSTSTPKGVIVSHSNLEHNQKIIRDVFDTNSNTIMFSWLPFQHDMGLVGNILHNIFVGGTCVLMSPFNFMQQPLSWLLGITKYGVTHSGAPNFAYDYCVNRIVPTEINRLDLSSWKYAYNGSEPVRHETLQRFSDFFAPAGFSFRAFYPCYGLAEATLIVSGARAHGTPAVIQSIQNICSDIEYNSNAIERKIVSCGKVPSGMEVIICSNGKICGESEEGEILVGGESITGGYWNRNELELFEFVEGEKYLKTGDLGFFKNNELFVCGRLNEMFVIRGRNIYPYDIERKLTVIESFIEENGVAIFPTTYGNDDSIVVVAELKRTLTKSTSFDNLISSIDKATCEMVGVAPFDVVIVPKLGIPRTTSGKIKRIECGKMYEGGGLRVLSSKRTLNINKVGRSSLQEHVGEKGDHYWQDINLRDYLAKLIASKTGDVIIKEHEYGQSLFSIGIDSLRLAEIINTINNDFKIQLDIPTIMQDNSFNGLIKNIENMLWLKNAPIKGRQIVL